MGMSGKGERAKVNKGWELIETCSDEKGSDALDCFSKDFMSAAGLQVQVRAFPADGLLVALASVTAPRGGCGYLGNDQASTPSCNSA